MSDRWTRWLGISLGLMALLAANYYLRSTLEDAPRYLYSFLERFYPKEVPVIFDELPTWRLFLPLREITGAWVTTTLILVYLVERVITPAGAWYLFNAASILVAFGSSWVLFRSAVFSFTFAICVGFGTQFYHAYAVAGGIASYLVVCYHMLLMFTAVQLVRGATPRWAWYGAFVGSLALNMFGYEGWLDVLALVWVATPFAYVGLRRLELVPESARLLRVAAAITFAGVLYIGVKVAFGFGQTTGAESDVVLNYDSIWLIVDDLISNVFTHTYLSVSNFLPPVVAGASSLYLLGADHLIASQHGHHAGFEYLVAMHQVFFWRYYAGGSLVILCFAIYRANVRMWSKPSPWTLALIVFLLMLLVPGSTHTLIKFRPMNTMPVMTYHVTVGVLGASLVIAWLMTTAWREWRSRKLAVALVLAVWATLFYGALERPVYLAYMAAQSGLGEYLYPNPMRMLIEKLGGTYHAPKGMELYRLAPFRRDDALASARARLADLPVMLPAVETWTKNADEFTATPVRGGGIELNGDASQFGYQIVSPPILVRPNHSYLLRVVYEVVDGRVCVGLLSGDQQRWVVAPDGSTVEYAFDSGALDAIRVVVANCNLSDLGNPKSRFKLIKGSMAAIRPAEPAP